MIDLVKRTFAEWSEDRVSRLAAALSYYTIFSLAPLLVLIIALAGLFGWQAQAQTGILTQIENLIGAEGRQFIESMVTAAGQQKATGVVASIIGLVTLLFGALGVFGQLQEALNTIWEVEVKPIQGLWNKISQLLLKRLLSFSMILVIGFLLLVSLGVSAALASFTEYTSTILPLSEIILQIINFLVSFAVITLLFALIYKILPDVEMAWKDVWLGAAVTSLLFTLGKFLIGIYLGQSNIGTTFGAAGSLAILLIWIYYSAQIVFLGAEFTQVYANTYGSKVRPDKNAVPLTDEARARQGLERREPFPAVPQREHETLLGPTGRTALVTHPSPFTSPFEGSYVYRDRHGRRSLFSKLFYGLLMTTQFIPAVLSLSSTNTRPSESQEIHREAP